MEKELNTRTEQEKMMKIINSPLIPLVYGKHTPSMNWLDRDNWINYQVNFIPIGGVVEWKEPQEIGGKIYTKIMSSVVTGYAVLTGAESKIMILDIDNKKGKNGSDQLNNIMAQNMTVDEILQVKSTLRVETPNRGEHYYFKYKEGLKDEEVVEGIEIKINNPIPLADNKKINDEGEEKLYTIKQEGEILEMPESLFKALQEFSKNKIQDKPQDEIRKPLKEIEKGVEMTRRGAVNHLRRRLEDYIKNKCLNPKVNTKNINIKKNFSCLNPGHEDKHPSMSINKKNPDHPRAVCHSTHCQTMDVETGEVRKLHLDIFDLIGVDYNLTEFRDQLDKACELYGITIMETPEEGIQFPYEGKKKGYPLKIWENLDYLLRIQGIEVKYNLNMKRAEVVGETQTSTDALMVNLHSLCIRNGLNLSFDDLKRFIVVIAEKNPYAPFLDYVKECAENWDGVSRIKDICDTVELVDKEDNEKKGVYITKWLASAVHLQDNDGSKSAEGILTICGEQYIGKTRWIESLFPKENKEWVKIGLSINPSDKDSVIKATSCVIGELGEVDATLNKRDSAEMKQFTTQRIDEYRASYGHFAERHPRRTVYYATVNGQEFLKDMTGNRRYWVIKAKRLKYNNAVDVDQLWGEIYTKYQKGETKPYLTDEEVKVLNEHNAQFELKTDIEVKLLEKFDWDADTTKWEILNATEIGDIIFDNRPVHIGRALQRLIRQDDRIKFRKDTRKYLMPPPLGAVMPSRDYKRPVERIMDGIPVKRVK